MKQPVSDCLMPIGKAAKHPISKENKTHSLLNLRHQLALMEGREQSVRLPFGVDSLDHALAGGLSLGRVHLITGNMLGHGAVSGFAVALIRHLQTHFQKADSNKPVVWCPASQHGAAGMLYGHGLAAAGLDPSHILVVESPNPARRLAALEDIARTDGLAAVLVEYDGMQKSADYWMRLARRAQLAAEAGNVTVLLLGAPIPPAGFETAWHITPSPDLAVRSNPALAGRSIWHIQLQRARGGQPHQCHLSWYPNSGVFETFDQRTQAKTTPYEDLSVQGRLPLTALSGLPSKAVA
jgi:protein ImuA